MLMKQDKYQGSREVMLHHPSPYTYGKQNICVKNFKVLYDDLGLNHIVTLDFDKKSWNNILSRYLPIYKLGLLLCTIHASNIHT